MSLRLTDSRSSNLECLSARKQRGVTLMEVMVALAIMAIIALLASQAFHTASTGAAATRESMERMAEVDRAFVLIENDVRYAIFKPIKSQVNPNPLPPVFISMSDGDYWLTVLRGSYPNPLKLPRTEEVRVGYRYIDEELWRDTWYNPVLNEQEDAQQRRILTGVTSLNIDVLASNATSLAAGPWVDSWRDGQALQALPKAIRITVELEDMGEIERLFAFLPGTPQ